MNREELSKANQIDRNIERIENILYSLKLNGLVIFYEGVGYRLSDLLSDRKDIAPVMGTLITVLETELKNQRELFAGL